MPRETVDAKGARYLTEARLRLVAVTDDRIDAHCRGDGIVYELGWNPGDRWWCNCPARGDRCCHLAALRLVTVRTRDPRTADR